MKYYFIETYFKGGHVKKAVLIIFIIFISLIVIISGKITFIDGNSVFKETFLNKKFTNLYIFVDITENKMYLISEGKVVKTYPVSSGKYKTPSPIGTWTITSKARWGEGFGGYWMGFNVPWGMYGIHGTNEPWSIGRSLSHGCIRMFNKDVAELYKITPIGTKVTIYGGPFGPFGSGFRILKPGDRGSDVYFIQKKLKELGFYKGYVNGIYNESTKHAIHSFQRKHGLYVSDYIGISFYSKLGIYLFD